jgi:hypothetical protein
LLFQNSCVYIFVSVFIFKLPEWILFGIKINFSIMQFIILNMIYIMIRTISHILIFESCKV